MYEIFVSEFDDGLRTKTLFFEDTLHIFYFIILFRVTRFNKIALVKV